jgi:predicted flap endonuclease-1-like 5' DNA nuclease
MEILWLVIGVLIGALAVWWYLSQQWNKQLAEKDAELATARLELGQERRAHETTRSGPSRAEAGPSPASPAAEAAAPPAALYQAGERPAAPAASEPPEEPDDLTRIKGIGRVLEVKLQGLGVTRFRQVADFTQADIDRINAVLDFPGRIEREKWVEQAKAFVGAAPSS